MLFVIISVVLEASVQPGGSLPAGYRRGTHVHMVPLNDEFTSQGRKLLRSTIAGKQLQQTGVIQVYIREQAV